MLPEAGKVLLLDLPLLYFWRQIIINRLSVSVDLLYFIVKHGHETVAFFLQIWQYSFLLD